MTTRTNKIQEPEGDFGVQWQEVNRRDEVVLKEKWFKTDSKRSAYMLTLIDKENFIDFESTSDNPY